MSRQSGGGFEISGGKFVPDKYEHGMFIGDINNRRLPEDESGGFGGPIDQGVEIDSQDGGFGTGMGPIDMPEPLADGRGGFGVRGIANVALGMGPGFEGRFEDTSGQSGAFGRSGMDGSYGDPELGTGWQGTGSPRLSPLRKKVEEKYGYFNRSGREAAEEVMRKGVEDESLDEETVRLAREYVMQSPGEYEELRGQLMGDQPVSEQTPGVGGGAVGDQPVGDQPVGQSLDMRRAERAKQNDPEVYARYESAAQTIKNTNPDDNRPVEQIAAELYNRQLRRERGLDRGFSREERLARRDELSRSRAVTAISRRHGGNPAMLRRAINNWNSRNPSNRLRMEDFGASSAGQDVRTRPGEVAEVDDIRSVNPRNVAAGSILMDPTGPYRMSRRPDGSVRGQAVMQDSNSGFYFPDPDRFTDQGQFDEVMSRQDRVNLRRAILQSGNSVMSAEQRRLEDAREAAANSIPEIRDAGLKEVNELERALHYRYINESAALKAPGPSGGRPDIEMSGPTVKPEEPEEAPTFSNQQVLKAFEDYFKSAGPGEQRRLSAMGMGDRMQMGFELLQPFGGGGGGVPAMGGAVVGGDRGSIRDFRFDASGLGTPPAKNDVRAWDNYTRRLEQALYENMDAAFESGMSQNELSTAFEVVVGELGRAGLNPQQMPPQQYAAIVARMQGIARDIGYQPTRSPAQQYPEPRQPTPRTPPRLTRQDALEAFEEWRLGQFSRLSSGTARGQENKAEDERLKGLPEEEKIRIGLRQLEVINGQAGGQTTTGGGGGGGGGFRGGGGGGGFANVGRDPRISTPMFERPSVSTSDPAVLPTIEVGDTAQTAQRLLENMDDILAYVTSEFKGIPNLTSQSDPAIVRERGQKIRAAMREKGYPVDKIDQIVSGIENRIVERLGGDR